MKIVRVKVSNILEVLGSQVISIDGNAENVYIDNLADVANVSVTTLDWVNPSKTDKQMLAENTKAKVVLVDDKVNYTESMKTNGKVLIHVREPKIALCIIGNTLFVQKRRPGTHSSATVSPNAKIGKGVFIGPHCVIENCIIGKNCMIDSNVHIYDDVTIGDNCVIKSGAVIGSEGFGFERDENGNRFRFPQIGNVLIGNNVEIGANTCVDRGALSTTTIGDYTKINNLCHIAHNNVIGKNVVIAAEVNVAGGNVIEDNVWIAPSSSLRGYLTIGKEATVGMGAVVVKNIPAGEIWVGNPAKKLH